MCYDKCKCTLDNIIWKIDWCDLKLVGEYEGLRFEVYGNQPEGDISVCLVISKKNSYTFANLSKVFEDKDLIKRGSALAKIISYEQTEKEEPTIFAESNIM